MSFVIQCPKCPTQLTVEDDEIGQQVQCPRCSTIQTVAQPAAPKAAKPRPAADRTQSKPAAPKPPPAAVKKSAPARPDPEEELIPILDEDELTEADDQPNRPKTTGLRSRFVLILGLFVVGLVVGSATAYFGLRSLWKPTEPDTATDKTKAATLPADDLLFLPSNCQGLATVNVPKLRASKSYKSLQDAGVGEDSSQIELVRHLTGLAPEEIERLTVGAILTPVPEGILVIRSTKSVRQDELTKDATGKTQTVGKHTIHVTAFGAFVVPDEHTVVLGTSAKLLESILERNKPTTLPDGLKAAYHPVNDSWAVWAGVDVSAAPQGASLPGAGDTLRKGIQAVVVESPAETPLTLQIVLHCQDAPRAEALRDQLNALIQKPPPGVDATLLTGLRFDTAGTRVAGRITVPVALFIEPLKELKWQNPEFWIESLADSDAKTRERAEKLLAADPPQTIPFLVRALDKGGKSRDAALIVLGDMKEKGKSAAPAVARLLIEPLDSTRQQALRVLEAFGQETERSLLPALLQCKADTTYPEAASLAEKMVNKLGNLGAEGTAQIVATARDTAKSVPARLAAVQALSAPTADSPDRVPALLDVLKDKDKTLRVAAAVALGKIGAPQRAATYPALVTILKDAEPEVSAAAAVVLDAFGVPTERESVLLLAAFNDKAEPPTALAAAAKLLGKAGPAAGKDSAAALFAGLGHADAAVRAACVAALDTLPPPDASELPALVQKLADDKANADTRRFILKSLNKLGDKVDRAKLPTLAGTLIQIIKTDSTLEEPALQALSVLGPPGAAEVPVLMELMKDTKKSGATRGYAARVLAPLGVTSPEIANALLTGLADADAVIRRLSAEGLAKAGLKTPEAAQAFGRALDDKDPAIRLNVTTALVAMPPEAKTLPFLMRAVEDDDPAVFRIAATGVARVEKPETAILIAALKSPRMRVRLYALSLLSEQKEAVTKDGLDLLARAARDDSATVRLMAVNALAASGVDPMLLTPTLLGAMKDMAIPVRMAALDALISLKQEPKLVVPLLLAAATDKADPLYPKAVESLGKLGDWAKPVLPQLMDALKKVETREAAGAALASIGKESVKELRDALDRAKDPDLQIVLLDTLAKIGPDARSALREVGVRRNSPFPAVKEAAKKASDAIQAKPK